jgi:hypothetical protein
MAGYSSATRTASRWSLSPSASARAGSISPSIWITISSRTTVAVSARSAPSGESPMRATSAMSSPSCAFCGKRTTNGAAAITRPRTTATTTAPLPGRR